MIVDQDWWIPYMPKVGETFETYVQRASNYDEMNFVMMEQDADDLAIIGRAQELMGTRHVFSPGLYCVLAIRDLIFCCYTPQWAAA